METRQDLAHKLLMALVVYLVEALALSVHRAMVNSVKAPLLSVHKVTVFLVEYYRDKPFRLGRTTAFQHWKRMLR